MRNLRGFYIIKEILLKVNNYCEEDVSISLPPSSRLWRAGRINSWILKSLDNPSVILELQSHLSPRLQMVNQLVLNIPSLVSFS